MSPIWSSFFLSFFFLFFICANTLESQLWEAAGIVACTAAINGNALQLCNKLHFQEYYCSCCICHHLLWVSHCDWIGYLKPSSVFAPDRSELIWWLMTDRLTFTGWDISHCFDCIELKNDTNITHLTLMIFIRRWVFFKLKIEKKLHIL